MVRPVRFAVAAMSLAFAGVAPGCVELGLVADGRPGSGNGVSPPDDSGVEPPNGEVDLSVTLRVSNPTPRANEQVTLTCTLMNGRAENVTFNFQPADGRLVVDHDAGTASFIVQESDVGLALTFTCTASDENGAGEPSNPQIIIASS